jgi:hypothetical protein
LSQLASTINVNIDQLNDLGRQFNNDVDAFNKNPQSVDALVNLVEDYQKGASAYFVLQNEATLFNAVVYLGEAPGLVTGEEDTSYFNQQAQEFSSESSDFQFALAVAGANVLVAMSDFINNAPTGLPPLPTTQPSPSPSPSPTPTPTGTVSESITPPPATWPSDALIPPTCSVVVTNPTNTPLTVTVSYSDTLGNRTSQTEVCTNSTITVADGGAVCPPGQTGTFIVSVTGQPDQKFTVTFQEQRVGGRSSHGDAARQLCASSPGEPSPPILNRLTWGILDKSSRCQAGPVRTK